jgi:quinol monooxygenase YgiN
VPVVVVAYLHPKPEVRDEVREVLTGLIPKVHAEDGCELYSLHEDADGFVFVEQWSSQDALTAHGSAAALAEMNTALKGKMAKPADIRFLTPIPAGTGTQGQVRP